MEQQQDDTSINLPNSLLNSIGKYGFERLDQEPKKLHAEVDRLESKVKEISISNYELHLHNYTCLQNIKRESVQMSKRIVSLNERLPKLTASCSKFKAMGTSIEARFKTNRQTLRNHSQLLELLDIPQLMTSCVRQKQFAEALTLCSFTSTLQKRHNAINLGLLRSGSSASPNPTTDADPPGGNAGKGIDIINSIVNDVDQCTVVMRDQLLYRLKQPITLPVCLNYISYLRRLDMQRQVWQQGHADAHDGESKSHASSHGMPKECRLRHEFLECRDAFLTTILNEVSNETSNPYRTLFEIIERNRRHWFDIINQYNNIFERGASCLESIEIDGGILSRWITAKISAFLDTVRTYLPQIPGCGSLANVLDQCMYFGTSLARVGADFRPLLVPLFTQHLSDVMLEFWDPITKSTTEKLASGAWGDPLPVPASSSAISAEPPGAAAGRPTPPSSTQQSEPDEIEIDNTLDSGVDQTLFNPTMAFLSFPAIAEYVNVMIMSFNELIQCTSMAFCPDLASDLNYTLHVIVEQGVLRFVETNTDAIKTDARLRMRLVELLTLVSRELIPYIKRCFVGIFRLTGRSSNVLDLADLVQKLDAKRELFGASTTNSVTIAAPGPDKSTLLGDSPQPALVPAQPEPAGDDVTEQGSPQEFETLVNDNPASTKHPSQDGPAVEHDATRPGGDLVSPDME